MERKDLLSKSERTSDPRLASLEGENKTLREDLEVINKSKAALEEENMWLTASNNSDSQRRSALAKELTDLAQLNDLRNKVIQGLSSDVTSLQAMVIEAVHLMDSLISARLPEFKPRAFSFADE